MAKSETKVIVVDLDGTLIRSDMLYETFWATLGTNWRQLFSIGRKLMEGRAPLKAYLKESGKVDVSSLPYNDAVLDHVKEARAAGVQTALVTASNQEIAEEIAAHLGIFDHVHGSSETENLKGKAKADFLDETFGVGTYAYVGDSQADMKVWKRSTEIITVNAPSSLRASAENLGVPIQHIEDAPTAQRDYIKALRPHQWMKNMLIFLPMIAAHAVTFGNVFASLLGFVAFSLVASSVYVVNDLLDLSADRAHPRKRLRPFAAGRIPISKGMKMALALLGGGFLVSAVLGPLFLLVMLLYYIITFAYSMTLKRITIIDICVLAGLYTLRVIAGGAATGLSLSVWLLAFCVFLFFSLAAVKRLAELIDNRAAGKFDVTGRGYLVDDIGIVQSMALGSGYVAVLVMALYINTPTTLVNYSSPEALWGICAVLLYWVSRTVFLAHRGRMDDDPVIYAVKDGVSRLCLVLVVVFVVTGLVL